MTSKSSSVLPAPPDQAQRDIALDSSRSVIVQAPAGSGKTDLLTRRFLRLLAEVDDPKQIVAITFTRAAAAEMRHRILSELENAAGRTSAPFAADDTSMEALAARALARSRERDWRLPDLASQLRISTIDSFCRELAIQQPIHSGIGNQLQINERPADLYRMAARATLEKLGDPAYVELSDAIRDLLLWRDNGWKELESLLVEMLGQRDRWMHDFVLNQEKDWEKLREQLEQPFARAVRAALDKLERLLCQIPGTCQEAHELAQFACEHGASEIYRDLAERANFPLGPFEEATALEDARTAYLCLSHLLIKDTGEFRKSFNIRLGFPAEFRDEKLRAEDLNEQLSSVPGLEEALSAVRSLPPARYSEEEWQIIRASFTLLRHAAGELKAIFAEAGAVDFIEVAQIARKVLRGVDALPSDAALAVADDIRHLLVDEFQDTSRRQHEFVTALIEAWPDSAGRTIFVVGDPMQSIYFFRDAEAELFQRVKERGFELNDGSAFPLDLARLSSNFRTDTELVSRLNDVFKAVFDEDDGSGIDFAAAEPARSAGFASGRRLDVHVEFMPQSRTGNSSHPDAARAKQEIAEQREAAHTRSISEIVAVIQSHLDRVEDARVADRKYRIAVLGRARTALEPIAEALREAGIPFRAVELESLKDRPEILDAVALARAVFNPLDRVSWLGVLRAPWCGLSLAELHAIAGADGESHPVVPIPELLRNCMGQLSGESRHAAERVLAAFASVPHMRAGLPTASIGTLMQQLWRALGGDRTVDDTARANLDLFWTLLDKLPRGEQDLVGPAIDAALEELCALPDPATSGEHGVQLMTIHKSKGLEFEVVIVPELQAPGGGNKTELLSWMERGLVDPDEDLTEFLIAPVQFKGTDPGMAKKWVERIHAQREAQEMRRILYVAATRAREELHLFARPNYKRERDGTLSLSEPSKCLLATAWPALGQEIHVTFEAWKSSRQTTAAKVEIELESLAASGLDNIIAMPRATILRRLPAGFKPQAAVALHLESAGAVTGFGEGNAYERHQGGLPSRALGNAVHKLLEELARLRTRHEWSDVRIALEQFRPRIVSLVRAAGIALTQAEKIAAQALDCALAASRDELGQWILSPHPDAASESGWAGVVGGDLRQIRVDRLFQAGPEPLQQGANALWIIDYKTAHVDRPDPAKVLPAFRLAFEPQLKMYAAVLRNLYGSDTQLRAGLYFPRMSLFDWWEIHGNS
ncbi:MAG TPA: UvrD-helicase domain-containing protein [Terracidiphilus sp.]|jgi:ATP-dependent exoDNAse (exonuclease V) beta subunit